MITSVAEGISRHTPSAASGVYPNAHNPRAGEKGEPKTVNVVRGPVGEESLTVAGAWLRYRMEGEDVSSDKHSALE